MIVTGRELESLVLSGKVQGTAKESHIDVTLSKTVLTEKDANAFYKAMGGEVHALPVVDLASKEAVAFNKSETPHNLKPSDFALFALKEWIEVPNDMTAEFFIDSRLARSCLDHTCATLLLPGWKGHLTLELTNLAKYHTLILREGMSIGKVVFHKHALCAAYSGSFNNQKEVRA